jgi:tRNA (cytidine/uridine-2'-O-)-methyltransferase
MNWNITTTSHRRIEAPSLHIVLYQPEIPANTGNIARLCGAAELRLHLIHPLGFSVDDRSLKRAGLDYWNEVDLIHHRDFQEFLDSVDHRAGIVAFSSHAERPYPEAKVRTGYCLLFGSETSGLPLDIRQDWPCFRIPIRGKVRSLNLSTSVGIVSYHYLHRLGCF